MVLGQEYWRQWFSSDYLATLWDSAQNSWLEFWNSDLVRELTKSQTLKLFGLSALCGAVVPILIMVIWRIFSSRKNKKTDYKQCDEGSIGSFNTKLLGNIKHNRMDKDKDDFDQIPPKDNSPKSKKKHSKGGSKLESNAPAPSTNEKKHKRKKSTKDKEQTEVNSTRFNSLDCNADEFKLNDEDMDVLSHMEFHGKLKSATLRARADKLEESMSAEDRAKEQQLKMQQLESIFKLMQNEGGSKFGIENKEDLMEQFKIYSS